MNLIQSYLLSFLFSFLPFCSFLFSLSFSFLFVFISSFLSFLYLCSFLFSLSFSFLFLITSLLLFPVFSFFVCLTVGGEERQSKIIDKVNLFGGLIFEVPTGSTTKGCLWYLGKRYARKLPSNTITTSEVKKG